MKNIDENLINISKTLNNAIEVLAIDENSSLKRDILSLGNYCENQNFRLAVFAPFNYGKSTLLNALLGEKTLPIDLIPTTGAAIYVKYGEQLKTKITLNNNKIIEEEGTNILKKYATLDDNRCMNQEVKSVEVYCNHSLLKMGVEFLDLPGTNDREEQNKLVKDQLLTSDLIIQVVDARKLMTLEERENFRDWLLNRGINSVILVINFLNLLEPQEQKDVYYRLRFVAESFRSNLPSGFSNLYRVDALPALRGKLKGDNNEVQRSGLSMLESALQTIIIQQKQEQTFRRERFETISVQVKEIALNQRNNLIKQLKNIEQRIDKEKEIKQKAQQVINQGFQRALSDFYSWLYLPKLLNQYQNELAIALEQNTFQQWCNNDFQDKIITYQKNINEWGDKACLFFENNFLTPLNISIPDPPEISISLPEGNEEKSNYFNDITTVGIPTGIGLLVGGPIAAAVLGGASYFLNKTTTQAEKEAMTQNSQTPSTSVEFAQNYLTHFSEQVLLSLRKYEQELSKIMEVPHNLHSSEIAQLSYKIQILNDLLTGL
ncbi:MULTISPECIES: dynamin family protein [Crocosphaera]|nr:dynamin family protein [Crocosphaera sp.]MCH2246751.1 dynamin family protein [Crocosphaera sp.]NQZ62052.1 dynamin family protein [Crocosphaera sp.]